MKNKCEELISLRKAVEEEDVNLRDCSREMF